MVSSPVGLKKDAIYLFEVNGFDAISNGFEERGNTKVASPAKDALGRTNDEGQGILGKSVVTKACTIELAEDEGFHVVWGELRHDDGISDTAFYVVVDGKGKSGKKRGLADEDKVVIFGKVFKEEPKLAKGMNVHEVGVIDEGNKHLAQMIQTKGLINKTALTAKALALDIGLKSFAKDAKGGEVGMEGSIDDGRDDSL